MIAKISRPIASIGLIPLAIAFAAIAVTGSPAMASAPTADPRVAGLAALIAMEQRTAPMIQRLAVRNARWCAATMAMPGWLLGDRRLYSSAIWPLAQAAYGATDADAPFIAALDPNGPAARAGLKVGDAIVSINGIPISASSGDPHARMAAAHQLLTESPENAPLRIGVAHRDEPVTFTPERGCASEFRVEATDNLHGKADGRVVLISGGMVRFADVDDELATVIAHELAHNILRHRERLDAAAIKRGLAQFFGRNARLTKITEEEADRLSVWLIAGAGYDPAAAGRFWTNYGKRHGAGIFQSPTHPTWRKRVASVNAEAALMRRLQHSNPNAAPPMIANPAPLE